MFLSARSSGLFGNEKMDKLSKEASKEEQQENHVTYHEIKTIIKNNISRKNTDQSNEREDNISKLNSHREEQVMIFPARTGHCQLLSHMNKLKLAHTNECPCGTGIQTVEHILQDCPQYTELRILGAEKWTIFTSYGTLPMNLGS